MSGLSSSGARIRGDEFQHTYSFLRALEVLFPRTDIVRLGVEDPDPAVHNADDVTLYRAAADSEFVQVKSSVDATLPATMDWLITKSRQGGPSILSHLFGAWGDLRARGENPRLLLVSNKSIDPSDPILTLRDGIDGSVARQLRLARTGSAQAQAQALLAEHLGTTEELLLSFLDRLGFRFGLLLDDVRSDLSFRLAAAGLRSDRVAVDLGVGLVRDWVTSGKRLLTAEEVREAINGLGIGEPDPVATVMIQALDHRVATNASVALDWVDRFEGDDPRNRRLPRDADDWAAFRQELMDAAQQVRGEGKREIHVGGAMRLPTWFAAGNAFGDTAGFEVEAFQLGELWQSRGDTAPTEIDVETVTAEGAGGDLVIVVSVSTDISTDVQSHLPELPTVGCIAYIRPRRGVGRNAVASAAEARGLAVAVRDTVRELVRAHHPSLIHLFLAMPGGAALLLGHLWDRVGNTQLYADVAPGYTTAYFIPN